MDKPDFSLSMPDTHGYVPDKAILGTRLRHTGNGKVYTVTGFAWLGATDEWGFLHTSPEGVACCRPMSHFTGRRANGEYRYEPETVVTEYV